MEAVKVRSRSGLGKLAGVAFCVAGVLVIAFYAGPSIRPLANHPVFAHKPRSVSNSAWIRGTFLLLLACTTWSLWIVLQVSMHESSSLFHIHLVCVSKYINFNYMPMHKYSIIYSLITCICSCL
jgi:hypothetical protein